MKHLTITFALLLAACGGEGADTPAPAVTGPFLLTERGESLQLEEGWQGGAHAEVRLEPEAFEPGEYLFATGVWTLEGDYLGMHHDRVHVDGATSSFRVIFDRDQTPPDGTYRLLITVKARKANSRRDAELASAGVEVELLEPEWL